MKPEMVKKWTDALRSGKYKQGKGALKTSFKDGARSMYCCLGVLCDLYPEMKLNYTELDVPQNEFIERYFEIGFPGALGDLTKSYTITKEIVDGFPEDIICKTLAELNDNGMPFDKIADVIEKEYLK